MWCQQVKTENSNGHTALPILAARGALMGRVHNTSGHPAYGILWRRPGVKHGRKSRGNGRGMRRHGLL